MSVDHPTVVLPFSHYVLLNPLLATMTSSSSSCQVHGQRMHAPLQLLLERAVEAAVALHLAHPLKHLRAHHNLEVGLGPFPFGLVAHGRVVGVQVGLVGDLQHTGAVLLHDLSH